MPVSQRQFGMIGTAVMGRNLALNILDHGFSVAAYNRETDLLDRAVAESEGRLLPTATLEELVRSVERPRRLMMMIKAGDPVDQVMEALRPLLEPGDILIDGGNSLFHDTRRREGSYAADGLRFFGVGVSGGEEGARHGPSLMPGGDREGYALLAPVFEAIAATTDSGPCVTYVGPDGAGHFVKMVHNGIEYADMQLIAEAYDVLARVGGMGPEALARVFAQWNRGPLESFLIEITAKILAKRDPSGTPLIDTVLDKAGQKGTGRWTVQTALDLGIPIPGIAAAVDARALSSMKAERVAASGVLAGPGKGPTTPDPQDLVDAVHDALFASKVTSYAQGFDLIDAGSREYGWEIHPGELARIWKGGCIIRARLLDTIMNAYNDGRRPANLLLDERFIREVGKRQGHWRRVVGLAQQHGIPVPAFGSSLAYFDSYRTADLPQNLTQAQRDAFGAHTYQRKDNPEGPAVHSEWLE